MHAVTLLFNYNCNWGKNVVASLFYRETKNSLSRQLLMPDSKYVYFLHRRKTSTKDLFINLEHIAAVLVS